MRISRVFFAILNKNVIVQKNIFVRLGLSRTKKKHFNKTLSCVFKLIIRPIFSFQNLIKSCFHVKLDKELNEINKILLCLIPLINKLNNRFLKPIEESTSRFLDNSKTLKNPLI